MVRRHRTPNKLLCGAGEDAEHRHGIAWRAWIMKQVFHLNCVVSGDHMKKSNIWQACRKQGWGANISEDPRAALKEPSCGERREKDGRRRCVKSWSSVHHFASVSFRTPSIHYLGFLILSVVVFVV